MELTEHERLIILHALRLAAERFELDAALMRQSGQNSLAAHFDLQAADSRKVAERIEQED